MIDFSFKHTDLSYQQWYSLLIQLMPEMIIDETEGELVISSGIDAISVFNNVITDMEEEREMK
jgi:hypothetical protein